jgi:hypothetical protein
MPAQIGIYTFSTWRGQLRRAERKSLRIEAPAGVDGVGIAFGAWTAPESTIQTRATLAPASVAAFVDAYRALIGTVQTVIDGYGRSVANVLVVNVATTTWATGVSNLDCIECEWTLQLPTEHA